MGQTRLTLDGGVSAIRFAAIVAMRLAVHVAEHWVLVPAAITLGCSGAVVSCPSFGSLFTHF